MDFESIFGVLILIVFVYVVYSNIKNEQVAENNLYVSIRKTAIAKSKKIINKHKKQLAIQREKSVYKDSYGKLIETNWFNHEIPYFVENHIFPILNSDELNNYHMYAHDLNILIDVAAINNYVDKNEFNPKMDGFEFELFCADKLKKEGWVVSKTKSGADQGIDLIIEKGKRKIGVQCKKYAKPVGNKAVQEVKAGLDFYKIDEGIVLGSSSFTKSAIALANSNNIKLLHYLETKTI